MQDDHVSFRLRSSFQEVSRSIRLTVSRVQTDKKRHTGLSKESNGLITIESNGKIIQRQSNSEI